MELLAPCEQGLVADTPMLPPNTSSDLLSGRLHAAGLGGGRPALHAPVLSWARLRSQKVSHHFRGTRADFAGEVTPLNLALDGSTANVALRRSGLQVVVDVLDRRGSVRVVTTS
jgi:hypothetical protein